MFFNLTGQFYRHATEISNKRNTVKNLNWQEADQLGRVTKRDRGLPRNKNPAGGTVDAENPETPDYNTSALKQPRWLIKFFPYLQNPLIYNWAHNLLLRNICID